ncbi:hypothetical protein ED352_09945 [Muribaculaceae bacterium Isolate-002 (NCI)]|nr:hypothetical protein ED352_09945 [Muribaculaceae bacterium Isolate-002 (NCI)]
MKRICTIFTLVALICLTSATASAQNRDRKQFRDDIREYKHNYFKQKLDLSREQANSFFDLYDKMDDAITALNDEARTLETRIYGAPDGTITDIEYEVATRTLIEVKEKEAAIEKEYYDKFNEILNKKQLFELRKVERDFTMQLLKYHHKNGKKK